MCKNEITTHLIMMLRRQCDNIFKVFSTAVQCVVAITIIIITIIILQKCASVYK